MYDGRTRLGVLLIPDMVLLELPGPRAAGPSGSAANCRANVTFGRGDMPARAH
jgi:hypothetical protein